MKMEQYGYAQQAARLLAAHGPAGESPPDRRRDAVVAAMALAIAAKARRSRLVMLGAVAAVAAAASIALLVRASYPAAGASAAILTVETLAGDSHLVRGRKTHALAAHSRVLPGDVVRADEGSTATLTTPAGTHLTLSSSAELRVDQLAPSWRFSLMRGQLRADVTKLTPSERFVVGVPDGEIEVRGTVFRVVTARPAAGCSSSQSRSTVDVDEGIVAVRAGGTEVVLRPGESWTSACPKPAAGNEPAGNPVAPAAEVPAPRSPQPVAAPRPPSRTPAAKPVPSAVTGTAAPASPSESPATSQLAEQNDLFAAAMAAERQGRHDEALRRLDALLERFPTGPLTESARLEQQRILAAQAAR